MLRWPQIWPQWVSQMCWTWKTEFFMEWKYLRCFTCWPRFHLHCKFGWRGSDQHLGAHLWSFFCYSFPPWDWRKKLQWWWWWWRSEWKLYGNWNVLVRPRKSFWIHPTQKETNSFLNQSANVGYMTPSFEWNRFVIFWMEWSKSLSWEDPLNCLKKSLWWGFAPLAILVHHQVHPSLVLLPRKGAECRSSFLVMIGIITPNINAMAEWCLWDRHWISFDEPWMGMERLWLYEHWWAVSYVTE